MLFSRIDTAWCFTQFLILFVKNEYLSHKSTSVSAAILWLAVFRSEIDKARMCGKSVRYITALPFLPSSLVNMAGLKN